MFAFAAEEKIQEVMLQQAICGKKKEKSGQISHIFNLAYVEMQDV